MSRLSASVAVLGLATAALALIALWGAFGNPSINDTSFGVPYPCLAPWDTVLNGADNWPGGMPRADDADIAARCRAAGEQRFAIARGAGIAAVVAAAATFAIGIAATRRTRRETGAL